jgi:alpha-galactosidase
VKIAASSAGEIRIEPALIRLGLLSPIVNGSPLENALCDVNSHTDEHIRLYFEAPILGAGTFQIEIVQVDERRCWLRYWIEDLERDFELDSFGIRFEELSNLRAFLRNGYFSWDGSFYVQPEQVDTGSPVPKLDQGYAMTQLLPQTGTGSVVIGFDRHDRFQQTFTLDRQAIPFALTIQTLWDRAEKGELNRAESERLFIFEHDSVEDALREWAHLVAQASPIEPRLSAPPISGWCSWYNLYAYINEQNILEQLRQTAEVVHRENLPMWVFQIDDGFTPEMGDWLEVKPQFPRGMKPLLDDIRAEGFTPHAG